MVCECKIRYFSVITQEKGAFFEKKSFVIYHLSFYFVPLHPLFSCDGELSRNRTILKPLNLE
jgi:hypothetical protein